ncbi:hypothetical protein EPN96_07655 [bacterium]|nr:MAG: hypothetical protein EPN96_07655 [bacterium]
MVSTIESVDKGLERTHIKNMVNNVTLKLKKAFLVFLAVALASVAFAGVVPVCKGCCCCVKFAGEVMSSGAKKCCCAEKAGVTGGCNPKTKSKGSSEAAYDSARPLESRDIALTAVIGHTQPPRLHATAGKNLSLAGNGPPSALHARIQRFDC